MNGWIVLAVVLGMAQLFVDILFFLVIVAMIRKIEVHWEAVQTMAKMSDANFAKAGQFIDEIAQFLVKAFGLDVPKPPTVEKISSSEGGFKN